LQSIICHLHVFTLWHSARHKWELSRLGSFCPAPLCSPRPPPKVSQHVDSFDDFWGLPWPGPLSFLLADSGDGWAGPTPCNFYISKRRI